MPIYEYRCKSCGYEFEELQSLREKPITVCPKCTKPTVKRILSSGPALVFKGSGFYQTDYTKSSVSPSESSKKKGTKKPVKKTETKSESKPESKPAASAGPNK
jgi:putative FmdB family regulatory protein